MTAKLYPPAVKKLIPAGANDPAIHPIVGILHVAVSDLASLFSWFNGPSGGIESHLYIRKDGTVEQYREFTREADAQLGGNSWLANGVRYGSVSIETQGFGSGSWTPEQQAAIKAFILWAKDNLGIPVREVLVPNPTTPAAGGWGYHSKFAKWNTLKKSCPGPKRIAWFDGVLVPWMLGQARVYYTVQSGDTIPEIAAKFGTSEYRICRLNHPHLVAGQKLRVR